MNCSSAPWRPAVAPKPIGIMLSGGGDVAGIASTLDRQCDRYVLVYEALFDHASEMACVDRAAALLAHDLDVVEAELYGTRLLAVEPA